MAKYINVLVVNLIYSRAAQQVLNRTMLSNGPSEENYHNEPNTRVNRSLQGESESKITVSNPSNKKQLKIWSEYFQGVQVTNLE